MDGAVDTETEVFEIGGLAFILGDKIGGDYVNSQEDAEKIYKYIGNQLKRYKLDNLLLKVHDEFIDKNFPDYKNFVFASLAKFVLLNSAMHGESNSIPDNEFSELLRMITDYELHEPQFDKEFKNNPKRAAASYLLRTIGKQLQWDRNIHFMLSRTLYLYEELINDPLAPRFIREIVGSKFEERYGVSLHDFIKIGVVLWARSSVRKGGLRRNDLDKARDLGMKIPSDDVVKNCLRLIVCDPVQFRNDSLFKKYNINPLLNRPLVRVWTDSEYEEPFDDKFIAPIPDLIIYRITIGLYYQLYNIYANEFATNFGDLFELYLSKIIDGYKLKDRILTEKDIDSILLNKGKKGGAIRKPDWVIFTDSGIILIECKATHYNQATFEHGVDARDTGWLKQITKSLDQFEKFEKHIPELCKRLGINNIKWKIQRIIVSYEPLWGLRKGPLREFIDGNNKRDWVLIPVEDMETIQPYIAKGYDLWSFISEYKDSSYNEFNNIKEKMQLQTGANDSENMFDSFRTKILDELLNEADDDKNKMSLTNK